MRLYRCSLLSAIVATATFVSAQNLPAGAAQDQAKAPTTATKTDAPSDYSDEAKVVEKLRREFRWNADGTGTATVTARIRVQTQAGVQELGQLVFGYNSANEKFDIKYLRVSNPDGSGAVNATDANFQDVPSQIERDAPSYSDYRERHITVPALRAGQVLEYQVVTTTFKPLIPDQIWFDYAFRKDTISLDEQLIVDVPKAKKFNIKYKPEYKPEIKDAGDRRIYTWKANYTKRETEEELKKKRRKQAREDWFPDIALTTFSSWEQIGAWYGGLQKSQMELTPDLKAKVAELIKNKPSDEEKIRAIYDFVAQDYRYVSLSFGVGRYQPHKAAEVFGNKYGDCKDKHTLLSTMLKEAGYKVDPVLIGSQRVLDPDVPSPAQFDHVFSAVMPKNADAKTMPLYYLDTTAEIAPFGLISYNLRDKKALLVGLDSASRLITTPPDPPFASKQEVSIDGSINDLGKLSGTVNTLFRGDVELALRQFYRMTPQNKWKDLTMYLSLQWGIGGEVDNVKVDDLTNTREPLKLSFTVSRPNFFDWSSKSSDVPVPMPAVGLWPAGVDDEDDANPDATPKPDTAADTDSDNDDDNVTPAMARKLKPIKLGPVYDLKMTVKLTMPANFKARTPVAISKKTDYAEYASTYKVDGQTLTAERDLSIRKGELPLDRKNDYQNFIRNVQADERQKFHVESLVAGNGTPALPNDIKPEELIESGNEALKSGKFDLALTFYQKAAEKEPKNKVIYTLIGEAHMQLRQFPQAEAAFRKQIERDKFDQFGYYNLGRVLFMEQKLEDAAKAFQQQLDIDPLQKDAHSALGEIYYELNRFQDSANEFEKTVSLEPDNGFNHANYGRALLKLGKTKEATDAFDKAVEVQQNAMLWNNIAYELADNNSQLDRAEQYAESAISQVASALRNLSPERVTMQDMGNVQALASYWDTLGWIKFKRGDLDGAEKYIAAAWKLSQNGEVADHLGQIALKRGNRDAAIKWYAQAMSGNRPKIDTRDRLNKLVADNAKAEKLIAELKPQIEAGRTYSVGKLSAKPAKADFFVIFTPANKVESVKFISGDESLKSAGTKIQAIDYGPLFPDNTPTKLVRRGTLNCAQSGECSFQLMEPEDVTSVD
jgi:tetratricopeptide (TPR) repeat protein/transglutaminase-like putative cysteine protease